MAVGGALQSLLFELRRHRRRFVIREDLSAEASGEGGFVLIRGYKFNLAEANR